MEDENNEEAQRFIRFANDGKTIELTSPGSKGVLRIRNSKIPIASDALRFEELVQRAETARDVGQDRPHKVQ